MYELTGQKYNRLFVIERDSFPETGKQIYWKCLCDCGNISRVDSWSLRNNTRRKHIANGGGLPLC